MKYLIRFIISLSILLQISVSAHSKVISSSTDHFILRHEAVSILSVEEIWGRLIEPSTWWAPDHTYSGKSENLSLELKPGGLWTEEWKGGLVKHGEVIFAQTGKQLRLNAPFGPLQEKAVTDVWTITLTSQEKSTLIIFEEIVTGSSISKLDELAPAVDFVKNEAIKRLATLPK